MKSRSVLILLAFAVVFIYFFLNKRQGTEGFSTSQDVTLRAKDILGKTVYASVCPNDANKGLCFVSDPSAKATFTLMVFSESVLAMQSGGYYMAACFGDKAKCNDFITVNNFNPYAANTKVTLVKNNDGSFLFQFFDGKFLGLDAQNKGIRIMDKSKALSIFLE